MAYDDSVYVRIDTPQLKRQVLDKLAQNSDDADPELLMELCIKNFRYIIRKQAEDFAQGRGDFLEAYYASIQEIKDRTE